MRTDGIQTLRDEIGIYEDGTISLVGQEFGGKRRLPCTIRSGNHEYALFDRILQKWTATCLVSSLAQPGIVNTAQVIIDSHRLFSLKCTKSVIICHQVSDFTKTRYA